MWTEISFFAAPWWVNLLLEVTFLLFLLPRSESGIGRR